MTQRLWPEVALGDIASVTAGQSAPQDAKYFGGSNRFVRVSHVDQASHAVVGYDSLTDKAVKDLGLKLYPAGTIIFPKSGASVKLEKRAVLPFDGHLVSHLAAVQGDPDVVDQSYLFYALRSHRFSEGKAEGYPTLKLSEIRAARIPLPPLPEQRAIAHVLRTVQRAKEATEQVITAAQELKKSLMQHLFTYGPVGALQAQKVETDETEIGVLPSHWDVVPFGQLFAIQQGKAMSKSARRGLSPRPFLRTANVHWGRIELDQLDTMDFTYPEQQRYELHPGDVLVCEGGDAGRAAMWAGELEGCYYQNHLHRCRPISGDVSPSFIVSWLETAWTNRFLYAGSRNTTTIPNISKSRLAAFLVPKAPQDEERWIVEILESVKRKIACEEDRRDALATLFDSLLHDLMTGRLRVSDLEVPA